MSRLLPLLVLNYLFSAPCYLKTPFLLANHNREIFSCILFIFVMNLYSATITSIKRPLTLTSSLGWRAGSSEGLRLYFYFDTMKLTS